jgi:hypothetical protein
MRRPARQAALVAVLACLCTTACSLRQAGISRMASALTETAGAYATDNDPEFVRLAAPSTLKMVEMLLEEQPRHDGLLTTACRGFTQYAYAFLQVDAELTPPSEAAQAAELRRRARLMYIRAADYCWRALELRHPGIRAAISADPERASGSLTADDVPLVYWLSGAWGGELNLDDRQLQRLMELAAIRVMLTRALALDEGWEGGALHEAFVVLDGMSPLLGGSATRAREHFDRAVALSKGQSAFAYVALASGVSVRAGNRAEFERLLQAALAVDADARPSLRLANLVAQRRARGLLAEAATLFQGRPVSGPTPRPAPAAPTRLPAGR